MSNTALEQNQITAIFETILFRGPTALELNSYTALVNSTVFTLAGVETAIETTAEAVNFVDPIIRLYQTYFNRAPDAAGIAFWVATAEKNAGGITASAAAAASAVAGIGIGFSTSAEFHAIYGATPNADAYVVALYQNVLGRAPDTAGRIFWDNLLGGAAATPTAAQLASVATFFATSPEFVADSTANINAFLSTAATIAANASTATTVGTPVYATGPNGTGQITPVNIVLTPTPVNISNFVTVSGDLSNFLFNGVGPTLVGGDVISNVQNLNISDQFGQGVDILPAGIQLSAITNIKLSTAGNAGNGIGTPFDTSGVTGLATLTVVSSGSGLDVINAASTTTITDTQNNSAEPTKGVTGAGAIISGGSAVTVTSNGGFGVIVGSAGSLDAVPPIAQLPTGAVTVTENNSGPASVSVMGGTSVTVNVTSTTSGSAGGGNVDIGNTTDLFFAGTLGNTGDSTLGGAANPTGAITVTDASQQGRGGGYITVFGGTSVNVTSGGGFIQVGDSGTFGGGVQAASNQPTGNVTISDLQKTAYDNLSGTGNTQTQGAYLAVFGGANVSVTTNTGGWIHGFSAVQIGEDATIAGTLASGAITLTNTASDLGAPFSEGKYGAHADAIVGGTTVTVTEAGNGVLIGSDAGTAGVTNTGNNPTGAVSVTETHNSLQTVTIDGGNEVTVNAQGQEVDIGTETGTSGAQVINQNSVYTGNAGQVGSNGALVQDYGGTTVTVNTTGGGVLIGTDAGGDQTRHVPTGAVTITDTSSGSGSANSDFFNVLGGATVAITVTNSTSGNFAIGAAPTLNTSGTGISNIADDPTGNVTIMNAVTNGGITTYGTAEFSIYTNGATTVSVTGSRDTPANLIIDVNGFLNGAGTGPIGTSTLTTVFLDGVARATTIDSNAISTVTIADSLKANDGTDAIIRTTNGFSAIPAHALSLILSNDTNVDTELDDETATGITVTTTGTLTGTADNITIQAPDVTALVFNNAAALTVNNTGSDATVSSTAAVTITATGSGALNLGGVDAWNGGADITSVNASTATGNVTVELNGDTTSFTGGSGSNVVTVNSTTGLAHAISGGSGGNNTIYLTNFASVYNPLLNPSGAISADFTGFQTLGLKANASGQYDVSGFAALIVGTDNDPLTLVNAGAGEGLTFTGTPTGTTTYSLKTDTGADSLNVTLGIDGASGTSSAIAAGTVTTSSPNGGHTGIETVTINAVGQAVGGAVAPYTDTINLTDAQNATHGTTALNITGDAAVTVTDSDATITAIHVTNSNAVDVTGVVPNAAGVTITGGAGVLTAQGVTGTVVGAQTQEDTVTISGPVADGDEFTDTINGVGYSYVANGGDTQATVAQHLATAIGNPAGITVNYTAGNSFTVTGSTSNAFTDASGSLSGIHEVVMGDGMTQSEVQSATVDGPVSAGEIFSLTDNDGVAYSYTATGADTTASVATNLAAVVQATGGADGIGASPSGSDIVVTYFTDFNAHPLFTTGALSISNDFPFIAGSANFPAAVDTITTGSGGGVITVGDGGSAGGSGSETVNLQASAGVRDTVTMPAGTRAVINGFSTAASPASDVLNFEDISTAPISNATGIVETNGVYSVSNGIFSLVTGTPTGTQELADVQAAIDAAPSLALGAVTIAGSTYVIQNEGGGTADILVQLTGVTGITGFGHSSGGLGAANTIELGAFTGTTTVAGHGGSATVNTVWDDTGFLSDTLTASASGITNTFNNLAANGLLDVGGVSAGNVVVTQVGAVGSNVMQIMTTASATLDSVTVNGDYALLLNAPAARTLTLKSLVDATNTVTTIKVEGTALVDVQAIAAPALTTIDASNAAAVTFGDGTALSQAGLTVKGGTGLLTVTASGAGDMFDSASSNHIGSTIVANGAGDTFNLARGTNTLTANGAHDTIAVGLAADNSVGPITGVQTIHADGAGDTITFHDTALDGSALVWEGTSTSTVDGGVSGPNTLGIGANDTVNFGSNGNGFHQDVVVTGTVTGATSSGAYAFTTLGNVVDNGGDLLTFNNAATETFLGQVNVANVTTLAGALDLAAATAAQSQTGSNAAAGTLHANNGVIDWFQFQGNTYIVEAVNNASTGATHTGLGTGDVVVKILGLVDLTHSLTNSGATGDHTLTL